ncbi:LuxR C-terminal-related transcriptional regulator [Enterobacter roggenkampii]|uniref:LuxR C-terminal-related transcriptional regulator n=1 Tax=Enterobacter roggenkampii TaxID=1812935 RepID=UPI002238C6CD|nr:LuxR C-terminal-related transcriptional regulator [Enterobacter roggenkampii]MCW5004346.1 LuxR C-terminal-related transcriptional regulator [Enterobacter roggenkampii]
MSSNIHIYSDNTYFKNSINILIDDSLYLNDTACDGNVVIIDAGSIAKVEEIAWPQPMCHILFVISHEAHKSYLSSFEWNVAVSYISSKCTPSEFVEAINCVVLNLKRRITCKAFYNAVTNSSLSERELKMTKDFMHGKTIHRISQEFNLNYKTVANYRSAILFKSFGKLDIKGVRVFNVSQNLSKDYIRNKNIRFNITHLYKCPI